MSLPKLGLSISCFNLIIFDSTGSVLDKIIDASLTISLINLLGSLAIKELHKNENKKINENNLTLIINNYLVSISSQSSSFIVSVVSSEFRIFLFLSCKYKLLTDAYKSIELFSRLSKASKFFALKSTPVVNLE